MSDERDTTHPDRAQLAPIDLHASLQESVPDRIIQRHGLVLVDTNTGVGVRTCTHPTYTLDDVWMTVTCSSCGERLHPYAVLRWNAGLLEGLKHERAAKERAECDLLIADIRVMIKRKIFSEVERQALRRKTYVWGADQLKTIRELHKQVSERVAAVR